MKCNLTREQFPSDTICNSLLQLEFYDVDATMRCRGFYLAVVLSQYQVPQLFGMRMEFTLKRHGYFTALAAFLEMDRRYTGNLGHRKLPTASLRLCHVLPIVRSGR